MANLLLDDYSWLKEKYVNEGLSLRKICELAGVSHANTIKRKLNRFGIKLRGPRESHMVGKEECFILDCEVLNGTLLGDGCICKQSKTKESSPRYSKYSSKEDYSFHVASLLHKTPEKRIFPVTKKIDNDFFEGYSFRTNTSNLLIPFYDKWYPESNNYKKIIPNDLILTPRMILYWFMDDGFSIYKDKYLGSQNHVIGAFCSESFTKNENEFLCSQLKNFGLSASVRPGVGIKGTGYRIFLNQHTFSSFLKLIGPCPIKSMEYKWKESAA